LQASTLGTRPGISHGSPFPFNGLRGVRRRRHGEKYSRFWSGVKPYFAWSELLFTFSGDHAPKTDRKSALALK